MANCSHCLGNHAPAPEGVYIDFRGYRWTPPFVCMGCGIEVCHVQWAFSRTCGGCDVNPSPTRRLKYSFFTGPRELIDPAKADPRDPNAMMPEDGIDYRDREKWPVLNPPKPLFVAPEGYGRNPDSVYHFDNLDSSGKPFKD